MNRLTFFFIFSLLSIFTLAQPEMLTGENQIFEPGIKTVMLHHVGNELSESYMELGVGALVMRFDDLESDFRNLYFTVFLCSADWEISELDQGEYMTGFVENYINDYEQSFNTYVDFTHYTFSFPNEMSGVSRSGNYLMVVYEEGDINQPVLARRFVVYENWVKVSAKCKAATEVTERKYKQEIDFTIYHPSFQIQNPYTDVTVQILQNNRWDNAISDLKPRFVKNNELDYDYSKENNFDGGNEFRAFDLKQMNFISPQVARIELIDKRWHCWLKTDPRRTFLQYKTVRDINGRFLVKNDDAFDQHLEADYVEVHFRIPYDFPLVDSKMFVYGGLSNWQTLPEYQMRYNYEEKCYEATILIKQGYYNYIYLMKGSAYFSQDVGVEGRHVKTENEYTIFVYNYNFSGDYDRVIGAMFFNSYD